MIGRVLAAAAVLSGVIGVAPAAGAVAPRAEDVPTTTPIKHFVYLMQESHSFDNYFGTYPGAEGIPDGICMPRDVSRPATGCIEPAPLDNRPIEYLRNTAQMHDAQFDGGRMDGFVQAFGDDESAAELSMAHYDRRDLPWYWDIADHYVLFDRFFASAKGGPLRNHMFWVTATEGTAPGLDVAPAGGWGDGVPTIFDRLEASGVSWKFYVSDLDSTPADDPALLVRAPVLAMPRFRDDPDLSSRIVDLSQYYLDLQAGTLPSVAFVVPSGSTSEHPPGGVQPGQALTHALTAALMASSAWDSSALLWSYDSWGGFYDHVPPPVVDQAGYGFRVPALLVSPYARRGHVDDTTLDATSGLAFISQNWGTEPLAGRDRDAATFGSAFDFSGPPRRAVLASTTEGTRGISGGSTAFLYLGYGSALVLVGAVTATAIGRDRRRRALAP